MATPHQNIEPFSTAKRNPAKSAHLRYVSDQTPGIQRLRAGKGFRYISPQGKTVTSKEELARIRALVIPPAWKDVWICSSANGHLQAVGRDARNRKQYRYHAKWREARDGNKYDKLIAFGRALPAIRRRVARDLAEPGLSKRKVLATVVRLLEVTLIRIGNAEYARANHSFGLTTMQDRHVQVRGADLKFRFLGKSGVRHEIAIHNPKLASIVRTCRDIPGQELFQFLDDKGVRHSIGSSDVNAYLHEIAGEEFTSKDFRTWTGTVLAASTLCKLRLCRTKAHAKREVVSAVTFVSSKLGNTKAVCRKCYIHPAVLDAFLAGNLAAGWKADSHPRYLSQDEASLLAFLGARVGGQRRGEA